MIQFGSNDVVPFIFDGDPAIDTAHPDYSRERYERTRDPKHLPLKEGAQATVLKVKRLTRKQFFRAMGRASTTDQVQEAVAYGVVGIEPADVTLLRTASDIGEKLDDASLDKVYDLGAGVLLALGTFIIGLSQAKTDPT